MGGRGKGKSPAVLGDFIALGSKPGGSGSKPPSVSNLTQLSSLSNLLSKKAKPSSVSSLTGSSKKLAAGDRTNAWESIAEEVNTADLVSLVEEAIDTDDMERVDALLCGAVKSLRKERAKPDQLLWLSLMYLVKTDSSMFTNSDYAKDALCSLLKRDVKESYKSKGNSLVPVFAASILAAAFQNEREWPEVFVRVYMDDAIGERVWVDHPECKPFVDNILTAFNAVLPAQVRGGDGGGLGVGGEGVGVSPPTGSSGSRTPTRPDDEIQIIDLPINKDPIQETNISVVQRYGQQQEYIDKMVLTAVREQLNRRQGTDSITRNFLRFLAYGCGLPELRHLVVGKLEMWLINPKISRPAQDLLLSVTLNCCTHSQLDVEIMSALSKMRLKTKPNINLFLTSLRDLCTVHPENLATMMKQTIFNELSNARNTNNMAMLAVMFQTDPEKAAASLAAVFLELLLQKDCYLRALRLLLREIVRCLRYDLNLPVFCLNLMMDRLKDKFENFKEFEFKERILCSLVDLITLSIFIGVSPAVREGFNAYSRGDKKDISAYKQYLVNMSTIQKNVCWWMYEVVPKQYKPDSQVYTNLLYKLLFMAQNHEEYYRLDNWPSEADRGMFFKITCEIPVHEDTILRIFLIGLHKNLPLNGQDCLTIAETMIKRAAGLHALVSKEFPILHCEKAKQFMECVWELTAYTYPETISLPAEYQAPSMAITASYWKAWQLLLIMSAHNTVQFGALGWDSYPTLRALMEMCITSQFVFPPPTLVLGAPERVDEVRNQELQLAQLENQQILEFESRLAAASSKQVITEQSSLLLSTITRMDPLGPLRRPPAGVLEQLKQMNSHYKLGHLLCRSRQPDFLLDILQRQGTHQAMPWLADLVESNEGSLSVLPVQCLCEFLLNDSLKGPSSQEQDSTGKSSKELKDQETGRRSGRKAEELLRHLQTVLQNPDTDPTSCLETLDYFLRRLSSLQSQSRLQALQGLRLLVTPVITEDDMEVDNVEPEEESSAWLLQHIPALPCFRLAYPSIASALREACEVESDPLTVSLYIRFLSQTCPVNSLPDLADLALDMASVIVERSSVLPALLPGSSHTTIGRDVEQATFQALLHVFNRYMLLVRQQDSELGWSESQDLINVLWSTRESATLHILVVHAQIILLTYGSAHSNSQLFNTLLLMWFPPGQELPRAYLVDTSEEALLIPDWLKLKMIRSSVSILVDSALRDLEPHQLVLFIQSFGIPVESMSKLLQTLDQAVQADLDSVAESVLDKNYMGQLVAVQHKRGASGGLVFAKALGLSLDLGNSGLSRGPMPAPLPTLIIPPRSTTSIPPSQVYTTLLHLMDCGTSGRLSTSEKQDTFRTLQKYLSQEISSGSDITPYVSATLTGLESILGSDLKTSFVTSLSKKCSISCSLFRLLNQAHCRKSDSSAARSLLSSFQTILDKLQALKLKTPLISLLSGYIKQLNQTPASTLPVPTSLSLKSANLEAEIKKLALDALRKENTGDLVKSLSGLLLEDEAKGEGQAPGILQDWLDLLDPTVLSSLPKLQTQLVFAREGEGRREGKRTKSSRPYLLSLLTHQASWSVLRSTVDMVLQQYRPDLDQSAVLDFLTACIHIPRLWQGRDQNPSKHQTPPNPLDLDTPALQVVGEYIVVEGVEGGEDKIKKRIPLILRCLGRQGHRETGFINHIIHLATDQDKDKMGEKDTDKKGEKDNKNEDERTRRMAKYLLLQVYMSVPALLQGRLHPNSASVEGESIVDLVSHTLLTALATTQPGRDWGLKMQEYEMCARKMVTAHPELFLRNLPLLSSSLQGRTQYDFSIFRARNHLMLYTITFGLLELAKPSIFLAQYSDHLERALQAYIDMCQSFFNRRDMFYGLIDRFVQFLLSWLAHGGSAAARASQFLSRHAGVLVQLSSAPGTDKMHSLRNLLSSSFSTSQEIKQIKEIQKDISISSSPNQLNSQLIPGSVVPLNKEGEYLYNQLVQAETQDQLVGLMQDMLSMCVPKPEMLINYLDELLDNISSSSPSVRSAAYSCLTRLLRHSPSTWAAVLPSYLAALECGDEGVVGSALENLSAMVIVSQEKAEEILTTVFRLGLYSGINVLGPVAETLSILNLQIGN